MTKPNNQENENTLYSWATGKLMLYGIGIAAGIFIWKSGILQTVKSKIFGKKEN
ncbi:MAG: hypothetical protein GBAus27B_000224 [Mycoplasmataceae bacterium]|nr:MAG: hypothetical protein GBAus27B_000224 [Mycoplasmataceae bacterium]